MKKACPFDYFDLLFLIHVLQLSNRPLSDKLFSTISLLDIVAYLFSLEKIVVERSRNNNFFWVDTRGEYPGRWAEPKRTAIVERKRDNIYFWADTRREYPGRWAEPKRTAPVERSETKGPF